MLQHLISLYPSCWSSRSLLCLRFQAPPAPAECAATGPASRPVHVPVHRLRPPTPLPPSCLEEMRNVSTLTMAFAWLIKHPFNCVYVLTYSERRVQSCEQVLTFISCKLFCNVSGGQMYWSRKEMVFRHPTLKPLGPNRSFFLADDLQRFSFETLCWLTQIQDRSVTVCNLRKAIY